MIRRLDFKKAIFAGILSAFVWVAVVRLLIWLGLPLFDLVYVLGTMIFGNHSRFWQ